RGKPGPRHANRHGAERAHQGPLPMAVAMARHRGARRFGAGLCLGCPASRVALAAKRSLQLGFEQFLDEGSDAGAHPRLERIKPILAEEPLRLGRTHGRGCDICCHGVISAGAPTPVMACGTSRRLRRPHIPTTPPTAPALTPDLHSFITRVQRAAVNTRFVELRKMCPNPFLSLAV